MFVAFSLVTTGLFAPSAEASKKPYEERLAEAERFRIANDYPNALNRYTSLVKIRPADPRIRANYGMLLVQTGNFLGGKEEIDRALILNPDEPGAHQALAVYYMVTGEKEKARQEYIRTIALDPKRNCHCGGIQAYLGITRGDEQKALKSGAKNAPSSKSLKARKLPKEKPFEVW